MVFLSVYGCGCIERSPILKDTIKWRWSPSPPPSGSAFQHCTKTQIWVFFVWACMGIVFWTYPPFFYLCCCHHSPTEAKNFISHTPSFDIVFLHSFVIIHPHYRETKDEKDNNTNNKKRRIVFSHHLVLNEMNDVKETSAATILCTRDDDGRKHPVHTPPGQKGAITKWGTIISFFLPSACETQKGSNVIIRLIATALKD